jgi:hypothetical protein
MGIHYRKVRREFANQDHEMVVPDMTAPSPPREHTLLLGWKGGANSVEDQLRRYSRVCAEELQKKAFIPIDAAASHDVMIIGQNEHAERLMIGMNGGGYLFPLLVKDDGGLALVYGAFSRIDLNQLFSPAPVGQQSARSSWVGFDPDAAMPRSRAARSAVPERTSPGSACLARRCRNKSPTCSASSSR